MSASQMYVDWRVRRAMEAIHANPFPARLDYHFYAAEFELELDDVIEIFIEAADSLRARIWIEYDEPTQGVLH
jgi:hypothetical protein